MKTFKRHRSVDEILDAAKKLHLVVDASKYVNAGSDHIVVGLPGPEGQYCPVLYNVFNGCFFCASDGFLHFSSDHDQPDDWYQAMLDFFYTDD